MTGDQESTVACAQGPEVALRETMRVEFGCAPLLERHLERLARAGTGPEVLARVREAAARRLLEANPHARFFRLGVTVMPCGEVYTALSHEISSLSVTGGPRIVPVEVAEPPALPAGAAKPAIRRYWDRARAKARMAGGDVAVLHLPDGTLIDGSNSTVWLVCEGSLLTPPAPPAIWGVARDAVFEIAERLGVDACEARLTTRDLASADEVFLSNAVGLVVPARGRGGDVFARVYEGMRQEMCR